MSGTGASLNDKIDLAPWGYAPGDHPISCNDCIKECSDDSLHFLHRHATRCAKHALATRQQEIRVYEGELVPQDPEDNIAETVIQAYDKSSCGRLLLIGSAIAGILATLAIIWRY
jgi:hypothetical protein